MNVITAERLRERLDYNSGTGVFTWKVRGSARAGPGEVAGTVDSRGYLVIGVDGKQRSAHRLAWLYFYGVWPERQIDHKDGDRLNNSIANLRDIAGALNRQNQRNPRSNNTSGFLGVSPCKKTGRWLAHIGIDGRSRYVGRYDTREEAHEAYLEAKRRLHPACTI